MQDFQAPCACDTGPAADAETNSSGNCKPVHLTCLDESLHPAIFGASCSMHQNWEVLWLSKGNYNTMHDRLAACSAAPFGCTCLYEDVATCDMCMQWMVSQQRSLNCLLFCASSLVVPGPRALCMGISDE